MLVYGMAGTFHEGVLAACLNHVGKKTVQLYRVWRGVAGRYFLVVNVIADGRE